MVHIILTAKGLEDLVSNLKAPGTLWLNADVATAEEVGHLRATGWDVSTWTNPIDCGDQEKLDGAVYTVWEHHPGATIWLEQPLSGDIG